MISRLNFRYCARDCGVLMILLISLLANPINAQAQTSAPGLLQPAYMPSAQPMTQIIPQAQSLQRYQAQAVFEPTSQQSYAQPQFAYRQPVQPHYYPTPQQAYSPPPNYYSNAERMVNSRTPRRSDLMATDQHSLLQYRRMFRNGTTPSAHELTGQWNGVNKGIVQIAGYGQFIKDINVRPNGQIYGDNIQVGQTKPGQVRLDGWQPNYDLRSKDYERRGSFLVQQANGRGFFGHGTTLSYADGGNPQGDPARLLMDQVVQIDGNHMLGRAVAKFGPFKIPLAYFVLERR